MGLLVIAILGVVVLFTVSKTQDVYPTLNLSVIQDGNYTGEYNSPMIKVKTEVTVKDNSITEINIIKHECGLGKKAESIVKDIVKNQSLQVDGVSGATHSSNGIKLSIKEALQ